MRFVPHENGVHQVHVRQNAVPVAGSPFNVLVGKQDADPAKVGAYGDGLSKGRTRAYQSLASASRSSQVVNDETNADITFLYVHFQYNFLLTYSVHLTYR